jgi:hypothetical protein
MFWGQREGKKKKKTQLSSMFGAEKGKKMPTGGETAAKSIEIKSPGRRI